MNTPTNQHSLAPPERGEGLSELKRLEELGVLRVKNSPRPTPKPLVNPYDASHALADRARSWLHVNCSPCHRNGAGGDVPSWFNYDQDIERSRAYDAKPVRGDFGILGARVITPGDPFRSTMFYRVNSEGAGRMPHIGSRLVDEAGVRLLRDWIASLPLKPSSDADAVAARKLAEENTALLSRVHGERRSEAIAKLLSSTSGSLGLLSEATDGVLRSEVAAAAKTQTNALVLDLFQRLLPPDQRRQTLGADFNPETILALPGNGSRGRDLFLGVTQCSRCHVCNGAGRAFGPDLTGIARKYPRAQLLEQILAPSKIIVPEYKTTIVTLRNDTEISGFVLKRSAQELVLRDENLTEHQLKISDLKETREASLSAMPEGLLAPLTAQEAADLLDYLWANPAAASSKP